MSDRLRVLPQYLLPQQTLTRLAGVVARRRGGVATTAAIRWFVRRYGVNMQEALHGDVAAYATFNDFFTRSLHADARPLADAAFVSPVDGVVSQLGAIRQDRLFQAKGHDYSVAELLGGDPESARAFQDGWFATLYLSPRDYHRIHMPCTGRLMRMVHVPGALFSVNPVTARAVPRLFARNERVVCFFEGAFGSFAMILVGATIVGSMQTVWHGVVNAKRPGSVRHWTYSDGVVLQRGEEMGRFLLGSTVILLFQDRVIAAHPDWVPGRPIRMGEAMGTFWQEV